MLYPPPTSVSVDIKKKKMQRIATLFASILVGNEDHDSFPLKVIHNEKSTVASRSCSSSVLPSSLGLPLSSLI